jgi:hypothetical protein
VVYNITFSHFNITAEQVSSLGHHTHEQFYYKFCNVNRKLLLLADFECSASILNFDVHSI